tara:strand:- start:272 stop:553 length:282 start_codon:yes stop_codon:yes gene_type:complete
LGAPNTLPGYAKARRHIAWPAARIARQRVLSQSFELGNAEELDIGNPQELGHQHDHVLGDYQHIKFFGVCCGTDHRRLAEIAKAGQEKFKTAA